jgi:hypothetical protein
MTAADRSDYLWLVSPQGAPFLAKAAASREPLTAQAKKLRSVLSPSRAHLVLEQAELRRRAEAKFSQAAGMFFTPRSLEQATSELVARWKAQRFASLPRGEAAARWADLCCGAGGDLLALAEHYSTIGVERDETLAVLAGANLAACGFSTSQVRCQDVRDFPLEDVAAWHVDPDRRTSRGRVAQPALAEPGTAFIDRLLASSPHGAVKLAPGARAPEHWIERCDLEWISERGECKQQMAWFGAFAHHPGRRSATILRSHWPPRTILGRPGLHPAVAQRVGRFVYDADAAVLAAGLSGAAAAEHGLALLGSERGYLTADHAVIDPALAAFEALEVLPFDRKRLKSLLRARGVGRLEIKKRGFDVDLARLRRELRCSGAEPATLLLTSLSGSVAAILARRFGPGAAKLD